MEQDRWRIQVLLSFRSRSKFVPSEAMQTRILFHLRTNGKRENLEVRSIGRPFFSTGRSCSQSSPCRWCSDPWRSCWRHPLCPRSVVQGGKVVCTFHCELHLECLYNLNIKLDILYDAETCKLKRFSKNSCTIN